MGPNQADHAGGTGDPAQAAGSADSRQADRTFTLIEALEWIIGYLGRKGDEHPRLSAERLISLATGLSRVQIYTEFDRPLDMEERAVLREAVKRRGAGEPLQYVTGETAFRHLVLKVRDGVLIPRPETEVTVECGLEALDDIARSRGLDLDSFHVGHQRMVPSESGDLVDARDLEEGQEGSDSPLDPASYPLQVLDLCTGSGCIALSIAQENPATYVTAVDLSPVACALASENAAALRLSSQIQVLEGDLYSPLPSQQCFDLIIANPPYIPSGLITTLPEEVRGFEPHLALDGGADGLDLFRRILVDAAAHLRPGGFLVCELHEDCLEEAASLARASFLGVSIRSDLARKDRVLIALRSRVN